MKTATKTDIRPITRRSLVQIQPPLPKTDKARPKRRAFSLFSRVEPAIKELAQRSYSDHKTFSSSADIFSLL
jgi:hypothetical protein